MPIMASEFPLWSIVPPGTDDLPSARETKKATVLGPAKPSERRGGGREGPRGRTLVEWMQVPFVHLLLVLTSWRARVH